MGNFASKNNKNGWTNHKCGGAGHINFRVISFFGRQFGYSPVFCGIHSCSGVAQEINRKYIIQRVCPWEERSFLRYALHCATVCPRLLCGYLISKSAVWLDTSKHLSECDCHFYYRWVLDWRKKKNTQKSSNEFNNEIWHPVVKHLVGHRFHHSHMLKNLEMLLKVRH